MDSKLLDFIKQDSTRLKEGREGLNLASASRLRIETASWMFPDLQCNLMRLSVSIGSLGGREREFMERKEIMAASVWREREGFNLLNAQKGTGLIMFFTYFLNVGTGP
ncbi:hypothetical protein MRB53_009011 [Persea americana]|uniref:Uncharacterized protein n=1 Tax=Persea americana TaxID=3435 RepID=A0ACC2LMU3_PERAE|nr:hypothetical protein MRB53_009011 [Persea americana]